MAKKPVIKEIDLTKATEADITITTKIGTIRVCVGVGGEDTVTTEVYTMAHNGPDDREVGLMAHQLPQNVKYAAVHYCQSPVWPPKREPDPKPAGTDLLPDLEGHHVVLSQKCYKGPIEDRILLARGGFGCKAGNGGGKIFGKLIGFEDDHVTRINYVTRMATKAEVQAAKKRHAKAKA